MNICQTDILDEFKNIHLIQTIESNTESQKDIIEVNYNPKYNLRKLIYKAPLSDKSVLAAKFFEFKRKVQLEYKTLLNLSTHPAFLKPISYRFKEDPQNQVIITEFLEEYGGWTLNEVKNKTPLTSEQIFKWARQSINALVFAEENNIFHKGLNLNCMYIDENQNLRITDFEISRKVKNFVRRKFGETSIPFKQNPIFIAPEASHSSQPNQNPWLSDVYSWGIFFYILLGGLINPEGNEKNLDSYKSSEEDHFIIIKIACGLSLQGDTEKAESGKFAQILEACLNFSPLKRPTFQQIEQILLKYEKLTGVETHHMILKFASTPKKPFTHASQDLIEEELQKAKATIAKYEENENDQKKEIDELTRRFGEISNLISKYTEFKEISNLNLIQFLGKILRNYQKIKSSVPVGDLSPLSPLKEGEFNLLSSGKKDEDHRLKLIRSCVSREIDCTTKWQLYVMGINDEIAKMIADKLAFDNIVIELNLNWNKIGSQGCKYISEALKSNSSLQTLYMGYFI